MNLEQFMEELAYNELLDFSYAENGYIKPETQPRVAIKTNDTLSFLHNRYMIRMRTVELDTSIKRKAYSINDENSVRIIYITPDRVSPNGDFMPIGYVEKDYFRVEGNSVIFNELPKQNMFNVVYQYKPSRLEINPTKRGFLTQTVDIPDALLPLVRKTVASEMFINQNNPEQKKTGYELRNETQFLIQEHLNSGTLVLNVDFDSNVFHRRGFI